VDNDGGIEAVQGQGDDPLDRDPRNDLPAPEPKTRKLSSSDEVVHEVVGQPEQLGCLSDGHDKPVGHDGDTENARGRERMLTTYYWCSDTPPLA
jgi:hypothetical protein